MTVQTRAGLERWRAAVEHDGDQQHVVKIIDSHLELYDRLETSIDETIAEVKARSELGQVIFEQIKINHLLSRDVIDTVHGVALVLDYDRLLVGMDHRILAALPDQPGAPK